MRISEARLEGPRLIEPVVHGDERGFSLESFRADLLADAGIELNFVQDNHSHSRHRVVRGIHFRQGQWS